MQDCLVDSHVHFWDPAMLSYPWLSGVPAIADAHRPEQLRQEAGARMPRQLVFVQAECERSAYLSEIEWVEGLAGSESSIAGIVAFAPLSQTRGVPALLDALRRHALVRGIRYNVQGDPDDGLCRQPSFVEAVRDVGRAGLPFDLCAQASQLTDVIDLVEACPGTSFVLDHAGKPDIAGARLDPWRSHVRALASCPQVVCKLSGLWTQVGSCRDAADVDPLRPYVDHLIECFGPERLLFGSDWPVVKLACSYGDWLDGARALTGTLTPSATQAIFCDNARRVYRLS